MEDRERDTTDRTPQTKIATIWSTGSYTGLWTLAWTDFPSFKKKRRKKTQEKARRPLITRQDSYKLPVYFGFFPPMASAHNDGQQSMCNDRQGAHDYEQQVARDGGQQRRIDGKHMLCNGAI